MAHATHFLNHSLIPPQYAADSLANRTFIDGITGEKSVKTWVLFKCFIMATSKKHKQGQGMTYNPKISLSSTNTIFPLMPFCYILVHHPSQV